MSFPLPHDADSRFAAEWVMAQRPLLAYITAAIPTFTDAEDVLQRVAVVAFGKRAQWDAERSRFLTWAIGIARFEISRWRREAAGERHVFGDEVLDRLAEVEQRVSGQLARVHEALATCIEGVEGRPRRVLEMRYMESLTPAAIADRLGTSPGVVNVTLHRVRQALRRCIRERAGLPGDAL